MAASKVTVLVYPATVMLKVSPDPSGVELKSLNTELATHGVITPLSAT